jgi:hypothetical protein
LVVVVEAGTGVEVVGAVGGGVGMVVGAVEGGAVVVVGVGAAQAGTEDTWSAGTVATVAPP